MTHVNKLISGCPRFLTTQFDSLDRDNTEKAVARYIRDNELTPKEFSGKRFHIRLLLPYLQMIDKRWNNISIGQMKTTPPRKLNQYMNTYISRWKKNFDTVQKVVDKLPESPDQTAELAANENNDITDSEHSNADQEEEKKDDVVNYAEIDLNACEESLANNSKTVKFSRAGANMTISDPDQRNTAQVDQIKSLDPQEKPTDHASNK